MNMTTSPSLPAHVQVQGQAGRGRVGGRQRAGYVFVAAYFVLLLLFGVAPTVYALYLALTTQGGKWTGFHNFIATGRDFRFLPAFEHIAVYLVIWLVAL